MEGFKYCSNKDCGRGLLPLSEFYLSPGSKDGYRYNCIECLRISSNISYLKNIEKVKARHIRKYKIICTVCNKENLAFKETTKTCSRKCANQAKAKSRAFKGLRNKTRPLEERFWSKVNKLGPNECWEWKGSNQKGYGTILIDRKVQRTHRVSYKLSYGDFDETLQVCHKCDNPPCCNPLHLFLGTAKENNEDKIRKGRANMPKGERNHKSKMTATKVIEMRNLFENGVPRNILSEKFNISWQSVNKIVKREFWKEVE